MFYTMSTGLLTGVFSITILVAVSGFRPRTTERSSTAI
jgi:hypothetical protein